MTMFDPSALSGADYRTLLADLPFREIWLVDFEFNGNPGDIQDPVCLVAVELRSGQKLRLWQEEFGPLPPMRSMRVRFSWRIMPAPKSDAI